MKNNTPYRTQFNDLNPIQKEMVRAKARILCDQSWTAPTVFGAYSCVKKGCPIEMPDTCSFLYSAMKELELF